MAMRIIRMVILAVAVPLGTAFAIWALQTPTPDLSMLLPIPLFHTTGCHAVMIPLIAGGGKLVFMHKWDPELALQIIERERITGTGGVPTIAWQLLAHPALEKYDLSSLESIGYGGAPAAAELVRRLKENFPKSAPGLGGG